MAFAKGKESTDGVSIKRYVGVGTVNVLAVNPTKDEWNKITGGNLEKEPEYTSVGNDGIKRARVVLLVKPDSNKTIGNIDTVIALNFWFSKAAVQGSASGKWEVIDKYGQTAWATQQDIENKVIPQYANGPANIDKDYRKMINGEEAFTNFIKAYLAIPSPRYMVNGEWKVRPNLEDCEARLENILSIFDGDFTEIKKIFNYQPNNHVQVLFGVRTTDDGKQYQTFFTHKFLPQSSWNLTPFAKELKSQLALNRYSDTYFGDINDGELIMTNLREYTITPSVVTPSNKPVPDNNEDLPFSGEDTNDDMPF